METIFVVVAAALVVVAASLFKNETWSPRIKHLIATVLSVVAAIGVAFLSGDITLNQDFMLILTSVYGSSQLIYNFIMRDTKVEHKLKRTLVKPKEVYE